MNTTGVAAIAFVCAQYADYFLHLPNFSAATEQSVVLHLPFIGDLFPLKNFGVKSLAIALVVSLTWLNYRSVKAGSSFQLVSTIVKIGVIALLVFGIFFSGNGSFQHFIGAEHPKQGGALLSGIIAAMTGAFFAYDGWINITFVAGEIKQPQKNIPRSLWTGVLACIITYVLVNQAYLYVLPVEKVAASSLVASDAMNVAFGNIGGGLVAALIVICTLGCINGNTLAVARVTYAMGKDKVFLPWAGKEHVRFKTPGNALWLHGAWVSLLIISGSFDMLADMMVFISWIAYGLGAVGIFILRKKMSGRERPYRIVGHPISTVLFIAFTAFFLVSTVYNDVTNYLNHKQPVVNSVLGMVITALGIPLYFYFLKKKKS
jgi:APA family basic amino acid/polyamine antiporter